MEKKIKKVRKINYQKIFSFTSFIFILVCILWYGGRFIYFYLDSKKTITEESETFARIIKTQNHDQDTFKQIQQDYYFYENATNNYVSYSNLTWRIIKVNQDNSIVLITDTPIGTLAYGNNEDNYENSNILAWLNQDEENPLNGKVEKILNEKEKYLIKTSTCIDKINNIEKITCTKEYNVSYLGLLSIEDYIYTGASKSFINNERYTYLANKNKDNEIWYINNEGKLDTTTGEEILGIKATITLTPNLELKSGTGTEEDPYIFEENNNLFGSYVKLGDDTWRIYEYDEENIKLILQDNLNDPKDETTKLKYNYSQKNYYHNDTTYGTLAYYLNHTYYNELPYKELIIENTYTNGYYNNDNDYQYQNISSQTIETKIALPSLEDILLNDTLDSYFTSTGVSENSSLVYVRKEKAIVSSKNVTSESYIVPCISIKKENLKTGSGTINDPYRTE